MTVIINSEYLDIINGKNSKNANKAVFDKLRLNINTATNSNASNSEDTEKKDDNKNSEENVQPQMLIEVVQNYDASVVEQVCAVENKELADENIHENNVKKDVKTDENTTIKKDNDENDNNILVKAQKEKIDASIGLFIADCAVITAGCDDERICDPVCKTVQQEFTKCVVQSNETKIDENISMHHEKAMADRIHAAQQKEAHCPKNYVLYSSLCEEERMKLAVFCCKKIRAMRKRGWIKKTVGWVRNVFSPKKDAYYCSEKVVNKSFYDLQDLVLKDAKNCNKIFRKSFDDNKAEQMLSCMLSGQQFNFDGYSTYDLVGMYKWYIRNVLNGLLPESITKALLQIGTKNIFKPGKHEEYKDVIKYLIFAVPEKQKRILQNIFAIFESVESNYSATEMDMKSLIICIAPSIFDSKFFKKIEHAKLAVEITNILYNCDYDKIDKNLYDEFCLYNKNK